MREGKPDLVSYFKGLWRELWREFVDHAARSYSKSLLFFLIVCVLLFFYLVFIPGYLFSKNS